MKPCVIANWKMYGSITMTEQWITRWRALDRHEELPVDIVLCPPVLYLPYFVRASIPDIQLGSQNVYCEVEGAYTGELSPTMLKEAGCAYVIVGHSERRILFGESDELVARKFKAVYDSALIPVLCVGETRIEREADNTFSVIYRQLDAVFSVVHLNYFKRAIIAYEPVWAIGTGLSATPEQAEAVHAAIRAYIHRKDRTVAAEVRLLYGGSVKASNARALFEEPNINGALVGGASLEPQEFFNICKHVKGVF